MITGIVSVFRKPICDTCDNLLERNVHFEPGCVQKCASVALVGSAVGKGTEKNFADRYTLSL